MYTGAALSFGLIRACRSGLVLCCSVLSDAGGENDGSSAIFERSLLQELSIRFGKRLNYMYYQPVSKLPVTLLISSWLQSH